MVEKGLKSRPDVCYFCAFQADGKPGEWRRVDNKMKATVPEYVCGSGTFIFV
jgi:hypothetical protein